MFAFQDTNSEKDTNADTVDTTANRNNAKYRASIQISDYDESTNYTAIDNLLETEKQNNKLESWNRINKTVKTQKLHEFAERYGKEHNIPVKDVKTLKAFFSDCLNKNKLMKAKEVIYDKERQLITSIPALLFNTVSRSYTLRITDEKRVNTLKCLTPKRITPVNTPAVSDT
jgi:hypothetical protein